MSPFTAFLYQFKLAIPSSENITNFTKCFNKIIIIQNIELFIFRKNIRSQFLAKQIKIFKKCNTVKKNEFVWLSVFLNDDLLSYKKIK